MGEYFKLYYSDEIHSEWLYIKLLLILNDN